MTANSYQHLPVVRRMFINATGIKEPGLLETGSQLAYWRVTRQYDPDLYDAIEEEAGFRHVEKPAVYFNLRGEIGIAREHKPYYAITIDPAVITLLNRAEKRAMIAHELRHLFQNEPFSLKECRTQEYECDKAALESTSYDDVRNLLKKVIGLKLKRDFNFKAPPNLPPQKTRLSGISNIIIENFWLRLNPFHPSPAARLQALRKIDRSNKEMSHEPA